MKKFNTKTVRESVNKEQGYAPYELWIAVGIIMTLMFFALLYMANENGGELPMDDEHRARMQIHAACADNPKFSNETSETSTFVMKNDGEDLVTTIPSTKGFVPYKKGNSLSTNCPIAEKYSGETYKFTYIDNKTNELVTVEAPKQFVTFEPSTEEEAKVEVTTHIIDYKKEYDGIVKESSIKGKSEYQTYVITTNVSLG